MAGIAIRKAYLNYIKSYYYSLYRSRRSEWKLYTYSGLNEGNECYIYYYFSYSYLL